MVLCAGFLFLTLKFTAGYADHFAWKLALNINPDDGHNFGYGASAWDDEKDVGNKSTAFTADYKSYDVALETANFIAIVRHQDGVCDAAKVWEFLAVGKTLHEYMNIKKTSRLVATSNSTYTYISPNMANKDTDPIFAVDGALVFNWWHGNDGTRISISNAHCRDELPATNLNTNIFFGLGNDISSSNAQSGAGSTSWWSDAGVYGCSANYKDRAQGTDHGTHHSDGEVFGQYAVFVSEDVKTFRCKDRTLLTSIYDGRYESDFDLAEKDGGNGLSFIEFVFDKVDTNKDGVLSFNEFSGARLEHRFELTADEDVMTDFNRIDKNRDGVLDIDEIEFDRVDRNKDGELSYDEYYVARALTDTE